MRLLSDRYLLGGMAGRLLGLALGRDAGRAAAGGHLCSNVGDLLMADGAHLNQADFHYYRRAAAGVFAATCCR